MPQLRIDLQDGFDGDTVVVTVNGEEIFREQGVRTKTQVGAARYVKMEVEIGATTVMVTLPERGLTEMFELDITGPTFLGVSLQPGDTLTHCVQSTPFRYL